MALNARQQQFIAEYCIDLNATQAAIRAGYSPKTAGQLGFDLLKKVEIQEKVQEFQEKRQKRTNITADRVLQELGRIALFDPRNLLNPDGSPRPINELDDDTAAVLAGMDISEEYEGTGEDRKFIGYTKKMKFADKVGALTLAMRHLGMLTDKLEIKNTTERSEKLRRARERKAKTE